MMIEQHPAYRPLNRISPWIYKLEQSFSATFPFPIDNFSSEWLTIKNNKDITVTKDYAWDGCSCKINILDIFIIGTPDGIKDISTMKPKTHHASMLHDVLYQFYGYHGATRKNIDRYFLIKLREKKFKLAYLYYCAVRVCGWVFFVGRRKVKIDDKIYFKKYIQTKS